MSEITEVKAIFKTETEQAEAKIARLEKRLESLKKTLEDKKGFASPLGSTKLGDPKIAAGIERYSRGMGAAKNAASEWANEQNRAGKLGQRTWGELIDKLDRYIVKAGTAKGQVRDLEAAEVRGFQQTVARLGAVSRVYGREHAAYVRMNRDKVSLTERLTDAQEVLGKAIKRTDNAAVSQARSIIGSLYRVNGFKQKAHKEDLARISENADFLKRAFAGGNRIIEDRNRLMLTGAKAGTQSLNFLHAETLRIAKLAGNPGSAEIRQRVASIFRVQGMKSKAIAAEAKAERDAEAARQKRAVDTATWLDKITKRGQQRNQADHADWMKSLRERTRGLDVHFRAQDKADRAAKQRQDEQSAQRKRDRGEALKHVKNTAKTPFTMMNRADGNGYFSSPVYYALAGVATAVAAARSAMQSAIALDTAETYAKIHMNLGDGQARALANRATESGVRMGVKPSDMLTSTVEAAKSGVPDDLAEPFARMSTRLAKVFGMNIAETTEAMGYAVAQELGAGRLKSGSAGLESIRRMGNTAGYLASTMATRPDAMMSFMRTGMGSGGMLGLSQADTLAFGAAATSAGAQGQQAARMLGHLAENMHELPLQAEAIRRKQTKSPQDKLFMSIPGMLGYGSYQALTAKMKKDPSELFNVIEKFGKIKDPYKRDQSLTAFFGADFKRFVANMAMSPGIMKQARTNAKKGWSENDTDDFQTRAWAKFMGSFEHMIDMVTASWSALKDKLGLAFKPFVHDFSAFFERFSRSLRHNHIDRPLSAFLNGTIKGFGFENLTKLLESFMPGRGRWKVQKFEGFGEGLTSGLKSAWEVVKGILSGFTSALKLLGYDASTPKAIGDLIGKLLGFSMAIHFARPAFSVLGFVKDGILGLIGSLWALNSVLKVVGLGGFAGVGTRVLAGLGLSGLAGAAAGGAGRAALGGGAALVAGMVGLPITLAAAAAGLAIGVTVLNWPAVKAWFMGEGRTPKSEEGLNKVQADVEKGVGSIAKPSAQTPGSIELQRQMEQSIAPYGRPGEPGPLGGLRHRMSYQAEDLRDLVRPATYGGGFGQLDYNGRQRYGTLLHRTSPDSGNGRVSRSIEQMGARLQLATLGINPGAMAAIGGAGGGGGFSAAGLGGPADPAKAFGRNFSTPGSDGPKVPGWFGKGGDGAGSGPAKFGMAGTTFNAKAPGIMKNLMTDFGLTKEQAAGVVANLGHESAGFTAYQEGKPLGGGRGGAGWAQWTGPRRRAFEAWAASKGLDPRSDEANYGFLKHELTTTHRGALANLKKTGDAREATRVFERDFEAAQIKHMDRRYAYADKAMGLDPNRAAANPAAAAAAAGLGPQAAAGVAEAGGKAGAAVDIAKSFEGMGEHNAGYSSLKKFMGREIRGSQNAWCAAFVNSSLKAVGLKGTGSGVANSFLGWGKEVDVNDIQKGDVAVEHRGKGLNGLGGHVGMATGNKRINDRGELELEITSGNSDDRVKTEWERASKLAIRRSTEAAAKAAVAPSAAAQAAVDGYTSSGWKASTAANAVDGMTSSGWKTGAGGNAEALRKATTPTPAAAAGAARAIAPDARSMARGATPTSAELTRNLAPAAQRVSQQGGGGGNTFSSPITIHAGNQSPQEMAAHVQRHVSEAWNYRSHDLEPDLT